MHTKAILTTQLKELGIQPNDTILIHSSMKAIGEVEEGAEGVLATLIDYMREGLLIFPTHTWKTIPGQKLIYDPLSEPSCVGLLSNLFMKREGVLRSLHPTHSVAAIGSSASVYIAGDEQGNTPCPRNGCWGKLYDLQAKILFIGCTLKTNTLIHGVEEWSQVPERLTDQYFPLQIKLPEGGIINRPSRGHNQKYGDISERFDKLEPALLKNDIAHVGKFGDAKTYVCDARGMIDLCSEFLRKNPDLFLDFAAIPKDWY